MQTPALPRPGRLGERAAEVLSAMAVALRTRPQPVSLPQGTESAGKAPAAGSTWLNRHAPSGCLVGLSIFLISLVAHVAVVIPLQKRALGEHVRRQALEADAFLAERSSTVEMAVGNLRQEKTTAATDVDGLVRVLRSVWPDFLSLEVIDSQGELIAMVGDLYLSDAGRPIHLDKPIHQALMTNRYDSIFRDDPQRGFFSVTVKQTASAGGTWFARARFSREPLEKLLLSTGAAGTGELVSVSGKSSSWPTDASETYRTHQNWLGVPTGAEALLRTPNWMLRVQRGCGGSWFLIVSGLAGAAIFLACAAAWLLPWLSRHPAWQAAASAVAAEEPVPEAPTPAIPCGAENGEIDPGVEAKPPESAVTSEEVPEWLEVSWAEPEQEGEDGKEDHPNVRYSESAGA
jgi:hypothetical protein